MSLYTKRRLSLSGHDFSKIPDDDIRKLYFKTLMSGMHGLCFSAYEPDQEPGDTLREDSIRRRMAIITPFTEWIRTFSCTEGNEIIARVAKEFGLKTMVGAWLGDDQEKNEKEIGSLIELNAKGYIDIAAVGNEVLLRGDLSVDELIKLIKMVKSQLKGIPVGYVDAYFEFSNNPSLVDACDVILANCYPFWEGCHIDYSLVYMKQMFQQAVQAGKGKKVIISETGWPIKGSSTKDSHPSEINFMKYFINAQTWSANENIEMFYFTSFDEAWKVDAEGDVGAHWGIWDENEKLKFE